LFLGSGCGSLAIVARGTELLPITCLPVDKGWAGTEVEGPSLLCRQAVGLEERASCWEEAGQPLPVTARVVGGLDALMACGQDWFLTVSMLAAAAVVVLVLEVAGQGGGELYG
jgi:hypothetical protein